MDRIFSREELARCNGENDSLILIACNGEVYDVTKSYHWRGGRHHALHQAGQDMTEAIQKSPHGLDLLERLPMVGTLED